MRTYHCICGNTLFFQSTRCLSCQRETGFCTTCQRVAPITAADNGSLLCGDADCRAAVQKCANFAQGVCNRLPQQGGKPDQLCEYCTLTQVIPDLSAPGNLEAWKKLERAKQQVLFILDTIGLEFRSAPNSPPLSFEFKSDTQDQIYTGHYNGCITINIREADSVEREKARVAFREPQRTLVGHIRHELGHYFWDRLVKGKDEPGFRQAFGDERYPPYDEALNSYHQGADRPPWREQFVSEYASMHPWEDFAETFGAYLDMASVLDTARHFRVVEGDPNDLESMVRDYQEVGLVANEFNRDMGLVDLVPEVFTQAVVNKLQYVHNLINANRAPISPSRTGRGPG